MKVKDLIQRLEEWDPDAEVRIGKYGGGVDWSIKGITVYVISPLDMNYYVYLRCEDNNYPVDNIPQSCILMEENNSLV